MQRISGWLRESDLEVKVYIMYVCAYPMRVTHYFSLSGNHYRVCAEGIMGTLYVFVVYRELQVGEGSPLNKFLIHIMV